ncbi:hypothetical protein KJ780_01965, partial [Candidatus Micrarchaeota archaeon]|nr:hypothetical protein [Candidatus Micrarchaeota archaeon]
MGSVLSGKNNAHPSCTSPSFRKKPGQIQTSPRRLSNEEFAKRFRLAFISVAHEINNSVLVLFAPMSVIAYSKPDCKYSNQYLSETLKDMYKTPFSKLQFLVQMANKQDVRSEVFALPHYFPEYELAELNISDDPDSVNFKAIKSIALESIRDIRLGLEKLIQLADELLE